MVLIKYIHIALAAWAIFECLRDRDEIIWFFIILFIPVIGPLLYFAYKHNWVEALTRSKNVASFLKPSLRGQRIRAQRTNSPKAWRAYGVSLYERRRWLEAIEALEKVLEQEGPRAAVDVRFFLGSAYKQTGRFRDAAVQLNLVTAQDQKYRYGEALRELADCHIKLDQPEKALDAFERLVQLGGLPGDWYSYGRLLHEAGRESEALAQMRRIVEEAEAAGPDFQQEWADVIQKACEFITSNSR